MTISLISKYRTQLMGIAIVWVMLFHSVLQTNSFLINIIGNMGYIGVDVFLFLSGYGVYHSLKKDNNTSDFLKKRFLRILPYYLPAVLFFSIMLYINNKISILQIFLNVTTISFWINHNPFDWYIPSLILFYILTPFIFNTLKNKNYFIIIVLYTIPVILFLMVRETSYLYLIGTVARIPIYITGILLGFYSEKRKKISVTPFIFIYIISCFAWLYLFFKYNSSYNILWHVQGISLYWNYPFAISFCFFIVYLLSFIKNYNYPILTFFGTYTLSLYIFHERIIWMLSIYSIPCISLKSTAFILAIVFAVIWQKSIDYIIRRYFH